MDLSDSAMTLLKSRYLLNDETPEELFLRVSHYLLPEREDELYEIMSNFEFLPNSPTLMNAGTKIGQLSACYVVPIQDSMESIFDAVKLAALIHKSGGGTGFDFSHLRPAGYPVKSTAGVASGPISFMSVFDAATGAVKQGGKRRGANMATLSVRHPDIINFINCKTKDGVLSNFNISVTVDNAFMEAVKQNSKYPLVNNDGKIVNSVEAKQLFDQLVEHAWLNGEPGIIFLDNINNFNVVPKLGKIETTNPCGEQPLLPYESCNLGSINLAKMVVNNKIAWRRLKYVTKLAVRALDAVIDKNNYPDPKIAEMTRQTRKIGLGIMGFADLLLSLKIRYDSEAALKIAERIMRVISVVSKVESMKLAQEKGPFPAFEDSIYKFEALPIPQTYRPLAKKIAKFGIRNATTTTIAPTGSLSFIADCSSGIEPIFSYIMVKNVLGGQKFLIINKELQKIAPNINENSNPRDYGDYFVSSHSISPSWHVRMQAAFQKYVDNAVSKTINLPNSATKEDVRDAILLAHSLNCKGITVYRDGSRSNQVLTSAKDKEKGTSQKPTSPRERPKVTFGRTERIKLGCGRNMYVTTNSDSTGLCEVFITVGKSGGCISSHAEAMGRLISTNLRAGVSPEEIIRQLKGIRCSAPSSFGNGYPILSCSDAVSRAIEHHLQNQNQNTPITEVKEQPKQELKISINDSGEAPECPECGTLLIFSEGCVTCPSCGYSACH